MIHTNFQILKIEENFPVKIRDGNGMVWEGTKNLGRDFTGWKRDENLEIENGPFMSQLKFGTRTG